MNPETSSWGEAAPMRDLTGAVLGDYRVERLLGRGGMGEVYLARQVSLDRPVALKVLRPDLLTNPSNRARFEAEAGTAARLNHPNIVHIYAVGGQGETRFIAMEYVAGMTLRDYLAKKGTPDLPLALTIMRQATQAVGAAGEVGLVHRDIKPENLLLTKKGLVKVADFGLCRDQGAARPDLTQTGVTMGTPLYMSPEQVQGRPLDHRSDLYSLGVTFYHMLAGRPPFQAATSLALAMKHVHEPPVDLATLRPDLPPEVARIVMRLIAKDPAGRYPSAAEVLRDLARARAGARVSSSDDPGASPSGTFGLPLVVTDDPAGSSHSSGPVPAPARGGAPRWRPGAWPLAAMTVLGLAIGFAAAWQGRGDDYLSDASPAPTGPPGLWMAPALGRVHARPTAEAQYHYAQLEAPASDRVEAWLAVPARFPEEKDHPWVYRSYVQLVRELFRRGDRNRLAQLAAELRHSPQEDYDLLSRVADAASAALGGNNSEVKAQLSVVQAAYVVDLAEVALGVTTFARRKDPYDEDLTELEKKLAQALRLAPADLKGLRHPGRPAPPE